MKEREFVNKLIRGLMADMLQKDVVNNFVILIDGEQVASFRDKLCSKAYMLAYDIAIKAHKLTECYIGTELSRAAHAVLTIQFISGDTVITYSGQVINVGKKMRAKRPVSKQVYNMKNTEVAKMINEARENRQAIKQLVYEDNLWKLRVEVTNRGYVQYIVEHGTPNYKRIPGFSAKDGIAEYTHMSISSAIVEVTQEGLVIRGDLFSIKKGVTDKIFGIHKALGKVK